MKQALLTMLELQDRMNHKVHPAWAAQNFAWYRAIWIECGELMDHYGYKWWKHQQPELEQVRLEVIDIWHFGLSALFAPGRDREDIADDILRQLDEHQPSGAGVREATEALAAYGVENVPFDGQHVRRVFLKRFLSIHDSS